MEDDSIAVTATTVRVPVFIGHSESVNIETNEPVSAEDVRALLKNAPGIKVMDDPGQKSVPAGNRCCRAGFNPGGADSSG